MPPKRRYFTTYESLDLTHDACSMSRVPISHDRCKFAPRSFSLCPTLVSASFLVRFSLVPHSFQLRSALVFPLSLTRFSLVPRSFPLVPRSSRFTRVGPAVPSHRPAWPPLGHCHRAVGVDATQPLRRRRRRSVWPDARSRYHPRHEAAPWPRNGVCLPVCLSVSPLTVCLSVCLSLSVC